MPPPPPPVVPTARLPKNAVVPETRSVVPVRKTSTTTVDFDTQVGQIKRFMCDSVQRALSVLAENNPMLTRRRHRDEAYAQVLTTDKMEQIYAQVKLNDFDYEQELMFFATRRRSPLNPNLWFTPPPCMLKQNCLSIAAGQLVMDTAGRPLDAPEFRPMPMMRFCTRQELNTMYTTGVVPRGEMACIRCLRYTLGCAVLSQESKGGWPPSVLLQFFGNKVDGPQGYDRKYCMMPSATGFNGLYLPLAQEYDNLLRIRWDPETQGDFVDQSALAASKHVIGSDFPAQIWRNLRNTQNPRSTERAPAIKRPRVNNDDREEEKKQPTFPRGATCI